MACTYRTDVPYEVHPVRDAGNGLPSGEDRAQNQPSPSPKGKPDPAGVSPLPTGERLNSLARHAIRECDKSHYQRLLHDLLQGAGCALNATIPSTLSTYGRPDSAAKVMISDTLSSRT